MAATNTDTLNALLERMTEMRREACRLQASTKHGTELFLALDELMAGCDDFLNVMDVETGSEAPAAVPVAA